jgi:hypothetical protein
MKLSNFSYAITKELLEYSDMVPGTIASFNNEHAPSTGIIFQLPCCGLLSEVDRLAYWDSDKDVTYGRYLLFRNPKWETIKFWTGFSASKKNPTYCIWFKEEWLSKLYCNNIKKNLHNAVSKNGEVWIPMGGADVSTQTLKGFWYTVLKELQ